MGRPRGCGGALHIGRLCNDLAIRRGGRCEVPRGPDRVNVLADNLMTAFPWVGAAGAQRMLTDLVRQGFLISCLRAPLTVCPRQPFRHSPEMDSTRGTSRLTLIATGTGLDEVYEAVPPAVDGALPVQMSRRRPRRVRSAGLGRWLRAAPPLPRHGPLRRRRGPETFDVLTPVMAWVECDLLVSQRGNGRRCRRSWSATRRVGRRGTPAPRRGTSPGTPDR
jgi:hypothetical protein